MMMTLIPYLSKNKKYGFANPEGKLIISPAFDDIFFFSKGFAWVKNEGKFFIINEQGKQTSPHQYDEFQDTYHNEKAGYFYKAKRENARFHSILSYTGELLGDIEADAFYEDIDEKVGIVERDGKRGVVDFNSKIIIPIIYTKEELDFYDTNTFRVCTKKERNLYNSKGEVISTLTDLGIKNLDNFYFPLPTQVFIPQFNAYWVTSKSKSDRIQSLKGLVDENGNILLPLEYRRIYCWELDKNAVGLWALHKNGEMHFINCQLEVTQKLKNATYYNHQNVFVYSKNRIRILAIYDGRGILLTFPNLPKDALIHDIKAYNYIEYQIKGKEFGIADLEGNVLYKSDTSFSVEASYESEYEIINNNNKEAALIHFPTAKVDIFEGFIITTMGKDKFVLMKYDDNNIHFYTLNKEWIATFPENVLLYHLGGITENVLLLAKRQVVDMCFEEPPYYYVGIDIKTKQVIVPYGIHVNRSSSFKINPDDFGDYFCFMTYTTPNKNRNIEEKRYWVDISKNLVFAEDLPKFKRKRIDIITEYRQKKLNIPKNHRLYALWKNKPTKAWRQDFKWNEMGFTHKNLWATNILLNAFLDKTYQLPSNASEIDKWELIETFLQYFQLLFDNYGNFLSFFAGSDIVNYMNEVADIQDKEAILSLYERY